MASSVQSYVNFQSTGSSSHLTRYSDGSFLTVWTSIDRTGTAYVYGKAFNADGTVRKDTFLIDSLSSGHTYTDITVATLTTGETVIAWSKSKDTESDIVLSLLDTQFNKLGDAVTLREIGAEAALKQRSPQIYALGDGGFGIAYKAIYDPEGPNNGEDPYPAFMHTVFAPQDGRLVPIRSEAVFPDSEDTPISTAILGNGFYGMAFVGSNSKVYAMAYDPTEPPSVSPVELGSSSGFVQPSITPIAGGGFITAWEDAGAIRAQVITSNGAKGATYSFIKPAGSLVDPPVITQLEKGGFAVAFRVDVGNGDDNVYTAAVAADGSVITNTTHVGTSMAGDQWDPSLTSLKDGNYAVSWLSDGGQFFVEVIGVAGTGGGPGYPPPPGSSTTWTGTEGNDVRIGSDVSETFYGLGGRDSIRAGGGNDTVDGGTGNDTIWGGTGNDVLTSGGGFDVFVFDTKPNKSTNKDKITDFSNLFDSIWLENKVFTKLGKKGSEKKPAMIKKDFFALEKAKDKDDYIIYSKKKATIYYDADGSGSKYKAVEIATVKKGATVTYSDFYVI